VAETHGLVRMHATEADSCASYPPHDASSESARLYGVRPFATCMGSGTRSALECGLGNFGPACK